MITISDAGNLNVRTSAQTHLKTRFHIPLFVVRGSQNVLCSALIALDTHFEAALCFNYLIILFVLRHHFSSSPLPLKHTAVFWNYVKIP